MAKNQIYEPNGWWSKEISPSLSLIVLIISTVVVFCVGALFVREYIGIWTEIGQQREHVIYFPEKSTFLEKTLLP